MLTPRVDGAVIVDGTGAVNYWAFKFPHPDATLDEHYDDFFHRVLSAMQDGRERVLIGTHILFVAKSLERIGDHATNIAEDIRFMVTGQLTQRRRKAELK